MFPLSDVNIRRTFPFVNYLIIAANVVVFLLELGAYNTDTFINTYAFVPSRFVWTDPSSYAPILYAMFMHGSLMHILGNMWFLHVFGDNIEDTFGHIKYLLFYMSGGVIATFAQYVLMPTTTIPLLGASGAVAAVAGAYFVLFRTSQIKTLVALIVIWTIVRVPAWIILGYWFLIQVVSGFGSLGTGVGQDVGGVAFWAHIGGFVFGSIVALLVSKTTHYSNNYDA